MRASIKLTFFLATLLATSVAFAQDPAPPPADPPKEEPKPADPPKEEPKPADTKIEPPPADPQKPGVNIPSNPTPTTPTTSTVPVFDHDSGGISKSGVTEKKGPKIAFELSMTSGRLGDPFVVYKGYTLENGQAVGTRFEANLIGISLSYELASLSNTQACADGDQCFKGSFGRTTINTLEIGYRKRFHGFGPVRPYLHAGVGGVVANIGDWSMTSGKTVKGGEARAALGVEIPFMKKFFASAGVAYRFIVVENPLRNKDADNSDLIFITNRADLPNGDYAEDAHLITGYLGIGVTL